MLLTIVCIVPLVIAVATTAIQSYKVREPLMAIVSGGYFFATVVTSIAIALFARASRIDVTWAEAMIQLAVGIVVTSDARFLSTTIYNSS
jgi:hypothetical protein